MASNTYLHRLDIGECKLFSKKKSHKIETNGNVHSILRYWKNIFLQAIPLVHRVRWVFGH